MLSILILKHVNFNVLDNEKHSKLSNINITHICQGSRQN